MYDNVVHLPPPPNEEYFLMTFFGFFVVGLILLGKDCQTSQPHILRELSCDFLWFGDDEPLLLVAHEVKEKYSGILQGRRNRMNVDRPEAAVEETPRWKSLSVEIVLLIIGFSVKGYAWLFYQTER